MPTPDLQSDILAAVAVRFEENARRNLINLQELTESTRFTKQEIMMMYRGFKQVIVYRAEIYANQILKTKFFCTLVISENRK